MYTYEPMGVVMDAYPQTGEQAEKLAKGLLDSGVVTKEQIEQVCAKQGFTAAKHGTSWDDLCLEEQWKNRTGPIFGRFAPQADQQLPQPPIAPKLPAATTKPAMPPIVLPLVLVGIGVGLYFYLK